LGQHQFSPSGQPPPVTLVSSFLSTLHIARLPCSVIADQLVPPQRYGIVGNPPESELFSIDYSVQRDPQHRRENDSHRQSKWRHPIDQGNPLGKNARFEFRIPNHACRCAHDWHLFGSSVHGEPQILSLKQMECVSAASSFQIVFYQYPIMDPKFRTGKSRWYSALRTRGDHAKQRKVFSAEFKAKIALEAQAGIRHSDRHGRARMGA
jgi:hypothetical protein